VKIRYFFNYRVKMLGNLFNSFHSKKENQDSKTKHSFLKKDSKKDKNKKEDGKQQKNEVIDQQLHQDINFQATPEDLVNQSTSSSSEVTLNKLF